MRWMGGVVLALLPIAACRIETPPNSGAYMGNDCGAQNLQGLIGKPKSALNGAALPPNTRVISPDTRVTEDYAPSRLNVYLDAKGVIIGLTCG